MRKKSHISLARYIAKHTEDEDLQKHRYSFYLGSILPDIKPSFVYKKHEITGTFPQVQNAIDKLINGKKNKPARHKRTYYVNLGQVTHYVADYFTYPHNKIYPGNIKDHCSYEEDLKHGLRSYLKSGEADEHRTSGNQVEFGSKDALIDYIQEKHDDYLKKKLNVDEDIRHIVSTNSQLVEGITQLFRKARQERSLRHS